MLHLLWLEDVELGVGPLVYMQVIPVFRGIASERVVEVLALSQVSVQLEPLSLQLLVVLLVCEVAAAANIGEGVVEKVLEPVVLGPWIGGLRPLLPLIVCRYVLAL